MKKLLALVMALLLLFTCAACGKKEEKSKLEQIKEAGKLVVGTSADYPPFEFHTEIDGVDTIVGIDVAICQYIADDLGVELELVDMNFDNLVMSLKQGEFDIVAACLSMDETRLKSIDFTDIVYFTDTVMITKKEVAENFQEPEDLEGHKIGAQSGSKPYDKAVEFAGEGNVVGLAKLQDLILEVQNGKVEGAMMDDLVANAYASTNEDLAVCPFRFERTEYSGIRIGVQKDNEEFMEYLNGVIKKIEEEGLVAKATLEAQELAGIE